MILRMKVLDMNRIKRGCDMGIGAFHDRTSKEGIENYGKWTSKGTCEADLWRIQKKSGIA